MKPIVLLPEPIHADGIAVLEQAATVHVLNSRHDPAFDELLPTADAVVVRSIRFGADLIARGERLKVIGRHGAGLDNIDLEAARRRGITVFNTPRSNTVSVAEYVIATIFLLAKRVIEVSELLTQGKFPVDGGSLPSQVMRKGLVGREIVGMRLGIVGLGGIGRAVAERAIALGMSVSGYDAYLDANTISALNITPAESLIELLDGVDFLTLHVPGGQGTLIGRGEIESMRRGSFLINTSRGDVVDAEALLAAVTSGRLAGAALDVYESEPPQDSPLLHTPGILCTPHMAAMTKESLRRMAVDIAVAVRDAL